MTQMTTLTAQNDNVTAPNKPNTNLLNDIVIGGLKGAALTSAIALVPYGVNLLSTVSSSPLLVVPPGPSVPQYYGAVGFVLAGVSVVARAMPVPTVPQGVSALISSFITAAGFVIGAQILLQPEPLQPEVVAFKEAAVSEPASIAVAPSFYDFDKTLPEPTGKPWICVTDFGNAVRNWDGTMVDCSGYVTANQEPVEVAEQGLSVTELNLIMPAMSLNR